MCGVGDYRDSFIDRWQRRAATAGFTGEERIGCLGVFFSPFFKQRFCLLSFFFFFFFFFFEFTISVVI